MLEELEVVEAVGDNGRFGAKVYRVEVLRLGNLTANETHSRVGGERSRAYCHPSGRLRPVQLNNGGACSDPGIERCGTEKLGMLTAGTDWTREVVRMGVVSFPLGRKGAQEFVAFVGLALQPGVLLAKLGRLGLGLGG